jgi:hypothetical protein
VTLDGPACAPGRPFLSWRDPTLTNISGATVVRAPTVAAPNLGEKRSPAIGAGLRHTHNLAAKATAHGGDQSSREGLANAVICVAAMLACVIAYMVVARLFMA